MAHWYVIVWPTSVAHKWPTSVTFDHKWLWFEFIWIAKTVNCHTSVSFDVVLRKPKWQQRCKLSSNIRPDLNSVWPITLIQTIWGLLTGLLLSKNENIYNAMCKFMLVKGGGCFSKKRKKNPVNETFKIPKTGCRWHDAELTREIRNLMVLWRRQGLFNQYWPCYQQNSSPPSF